LTFGSTPDYELLKKYLILDEVSLEPLDFIHVLKNMEVMVEEHDNEESFGVYDEQIEETEELIDKEEDNTEEEFEEEKFEEFEEEANHEYDSDIEEGVDLYYGKSSLIKSFVISFQKEKNEKVLLISKL
jgi:hypothetical protein